MPRYDYKHSQLALVEPNSQVREVHKGDLFRRGFRNILDSGKLEPITSAIVEGKVDLLICDIESPGGDLCDLIKKVRHNEIGYNPFLVIIATTSSPSEDMVTRAIDAGADDLIIKPVSTDVIFDRIVALTNARKPFVVTTDYIGPDRRKKSRPGTQQIPLLTVPNILRLKAFGKTSVSELQKVIDIASKLINDQKLERHAAQVRWLVDHIMPRYEAKKIDDRLREMMDRLVYVSQDISRRLADSKFAHVGDLCNTLYTVANTIRQNYKKPDTKDIKLLPELAQAIEAAFKLEPEQSKMVKDISESVVRRQR
ncbi:MAG: response regulator [Rhodospirillaceae bacterium]|nr:response regulator [Rhodospirillaceae bacterium]MBT5375146.1 response regulator [Rhodospirillaceae bacterium]MBT5658735.1 response regulator [Rhodospirillaceae bacterium]MBT5752546.1 response regulator [Rhodospirillaceae bacterium]